jgi:hypothetical protein
VTTNVTANPTATTWTAGGYNLYTGKTGLSGTSFNYVGQDVQMNVNGTAASGAATQVITFAVVPS